MKAHDDDIIEFGVRRNIEEGDASSEWMSQQAHEVLDLMLEKVHHAKTEKFSLTIDKADPKLFVGYTIVGRVHARAIEVWRDNEL
jgi:hypothetical protein